MPDKPELTTPPVFIEGLYEPTQDELTVETLEVTGAIPPELCGRYLRNGHNPRTGNTPGFWFNGNGMLHGVRLKDGRAEWYRNRFVRTPALDGAPEFRPDGSLDLYASAAATSVYAHAGRIFALQEVNLPYLVTPELETIGPFDFDGKLTNVMTAHSKIDRGTGEMLFLSNNPTGPFLQFHRVSPEGELTHSEVLEGPGPSIIHDFAITENWIVFPDPSVVMHPESGLPFPYVWDDNYQAKIGVMPRDRTKGAIRWIPVDGYFIYHTPNAWENADGTIGLECTYYKREGWDQSASWINSLAGHAPWVVEGTHYVRWTIDPVAGTAKPGIMDDSVAFDFPTISAGLLGREHRYTYAQAWPRGEEGLHAVVKWDARTGTHLTHNLAAGQIGSEPWFAPVTGATAEDDGWALVLVGDRSAHDAKLLILDASDFTAPPVATVMLPGWIPAGVHGSWIADSELAPTR